VISAAHLDHGELVFNAPSAQDAAKPDHDLEEPKLCPKTPEAAAESVWKLPSIQRGVAIEQNLAATEYADWYRVGRENNGFFPLVDFQQGRTLVSLRTVDTNGISWFNRIASHIEELGDSEAMVDDKLAKMELDLRVQPGGYEDAKPLIDLGLKKGVTVRIKEFP
jgi:filamentous hemagglutinin